MSPALFIPRCILVGFAARKIPPTEMTNAFVRYLLSRQFQDGRWVSIAYRPPMASSTFSSCSRRPARPASVKSTDSGWRLAFRRFEVSHLCALASGLTRCRGAASTIAREAGRSVLAFRPPMNLDSTGGLLGVILPPHKVKFGRPNVRMPCKLAHLVHLGSVSDRVRYGCLLSSLSFSPGSFFSLVESGQSPDSGCRQPLAPERRRVVRTWKIPGLQTPRTGLGKDLLSAPTFRIAA